MLTGQTLAINASECFIDTSAQVTGCRNAVFRTNGLHRPREKRELISRAHVS